MRAFRVCRLLSLILVGIEASWAQTPPRLEILSITTNLVTLSFSNVSVGATYRLHASTNLVLSNVWFSIDNIMTATDTRVSITDRTTDWTRYYRLAIYTNHTSGWFPFTIPWDDVSNTPLSAADLLIDFPGQNPATVIDNRGYIRAGSDGHFYFVNTLQRAKFWGINLSFDAALPPCPDAPFQPGEFPDNHISETLAGRLAKLGFNAVRLTHNDYPYGESNDTIVDYNHPYHDTQHFLTNSLTRLDYLIYQLKSRGIYVDLIMHCARQFHDEDGVRDADKNFYGDNYNNNGTLFDPVMIALQKKYAHDLLTHTNRYTGLRYADDPAVLFTEITNEDSLFLGWCKGLLNYDANVTSSLPKVYSEELDGLGINRLSNGGFESTNLSPWFVLIHTSAVATASTDDSTTAEGAHSVRVTIHQAGSEGGHVQLSQPSLAVQSGHIYTVSFAAKADATTNIEVMVMNSRDPWNYYGFYQKLTLTTQWLWHSSTFTSTVTDLGGAQFVFLFGKAQTTLWFDGVRFEERVGFRGWLGWLQDRYGTDEAIRNAWAPTGTVDTFNQITNSGFENGFNDWAQHWVSNTLASFSIDDTTAYSNTCSLKVDVTKVDGIQGDISFSQLSLSIRQGQLYAVTFAARAMPTTTVSIWMTQDHYPWTNYNYVGAVELTTNWALYSLPPFISSTTDLGRAQIVFSVGTSTGALWFDQIELRGYNRMGLADGESMEATNIVRLRRGEADIYSPQRVADTARFYCETERDFYIAMQRYIQEEIGSKALNAGTASYMYQFPDYWAMSSMDFLDHHIYWDFPSWTNGPMYSSSGWVLHNRAWVNHPMEALANLAATAVEGRPFTITEFNEGFPNRYAVEGPLLMATFANHQDWDAVFMFTYAQATQEFNAEQCVSWFNLAGHPIKQTQMPICSRLFLQGQNRPSTNMIPLSFTANETLLSSTAGDPWSGPATFLAEKNVGPMTAWQHKLRVRDFDAPTSISYSLTDPPGPIWTSDTRELTWDMSVTNQGLITVDGERVQAVIGFTAGRTVVLTNLTLQFPTHAAAFNAVTLQSLDDLPLAISDRLLLGVFTRVENTGMIWNDAGTSVDTNWGAAPTVIEPTVFTATLAQANAQTVTICRLDSTGAPTTNFLEYTRLDSNQVRFVVDTSGERGFTFLIERQPARILFHTAIPPIKIVGSNIYADWWGLPQRCRSSFHLFH